ncbi:hypothetical protein Tsubulata_014315 [Turnera subulata]|uniref:RRM domain-containing protein n=1 Tax=Turnera subulata TaxID=218843 RepID=A0A9Q0GCY3_9ROSI|nr:hypothetical protein Tsubulata_014315 [Turnera subulata]
MLSRFLTYAMSPGLLVDNNQVVRIYVENLPLRWLPTDVHLMMSRFGEVLDVFIPQKMNKQGKRFAFVKFKNNKNTQQILHGICSMKVDGFHLNANIARGRKSMRGPEDSMAAVKSKKQRVFPARMGSVSDKTFVQAVQNGTTVPSQIDNPSMTTRSQNYILKDQGFAWLQRCAVGVLRKPMSLNFLKNTFGVIENSQVDIIPIGGACFLFRFQSIEEMTSCVNTKPMRIQQLFSSFKPWQEGVKASDRLCWVLIKGAPPHVWTRDFFQLVTSSLGKMVD